VNGVSARIQHVYLVETVDRHVVCNALLQEGSVAALGSIVKRIVDGLGLVALHCAPRYK
jgi:hypothetical protein